MVDFGCVLKKLRQEKGMTQSEIAEKIGVSRRTYVGYRKALYAQR